MFIDLNVPVPSVTLSGHAPSKKQKGKQVSQQQERPPFAFTPAQLSAMEARIDLLVHCLIVGYTVLALNQTVQKKVDPKTHVNVLDALLQQLRKRVGVVFLKRLTIVLDEESEKGFGLSPGNASLFAAYDLIALAPTTATSFSLACLTHTQPSPLTAHIISLPLTMPRLPFNLKHTMVGTALKNGAVFELAYVGALGGESDPGASIGGGETGTSAKRNWWAAAREVVRVTKGKGIIVTSGASNAADLRAPRDVGNLIAILGLAQDRAHETSTKTPQSLILRAQTRKTYRAVLSEPTVVIPQGFAQAAITESQNPEKTVDDLVGPAVDPLPAAPAFAAQPPAVASPAEKVEDPALGSNKKRGRNVEDGPQEQMSSVVERENSRKKKKKKAKDN